MYIRPLRPLYDLRRSLHKEYIGDTARTAAVQGGVENTDTNEILIQVPAIPRCYGPSTALSKAPTIQSQLSIDLKSISIKISRYLLYWILSSWPGTHLNRYL
jgi:hypothetical protein